MDNINGALAFKATLDINDFNVSAQAMERSIKQVSSTAVSESSVMDNSIQSLRKMGRNTLFPTSLGRVWGLCFKVSCKHVGSFNSWKLPLQPCSKVVRKQRA